jgi:hypothetical protein
VTALYLHILLLLRIVILNFPALAADRVRAGFYPLPFYFIVDFEFPAMFPTPLPSLLRLFEFPAIAALRLCRGRADPGPLSGPHRSYRIVSSKSYGQIYVYWEDVKA